nr:MAG TPA: hypothetical protein [Caudoviricetes sp.]
MGIQILDSLFHLSLPRSNAAAGILDFQHFYQFFALKFVHSASRQKS